MDFPYEKDEHEHTNNIFRGFLPSNHAENSRSIGGANTGKFVDRQEDDSSSQLALATNNSTNTHIQKEHMFDKVVTPSDVGKLNRLVIPKQHAEKYFPLDSSTNEKGLLLNFEDRTGKPWRFRYSYWNSSQSYVMTKGWSRFVKEKKLDAGDIVSFQRGLGELGKDRLFIDWRRRVVNTLPPAGFPHGFHGTAAGGYQQRAAVPWSPMYMRPPQHLVTQNAAAVQYFPGQAQYYPNQLRNSTHNNNNYQYYNNNAVSPPFIYLRTSGSEPGAVVTSLPQQEAMVYESVPVMVHGKNVASAKKLRLFGVNMECGVSSESSSDQYESNNVDAMEVSQSSSPSTIPFSTLQQSRLYNGIPITQTDFLNKDKSSASSSMSLDFDI